MGEVRHRGEAAPGRDVGHGPGPRLMGQDRVGQAQPAAQDVPGHAHSAGGEDTGQLPLADPYRRRDLGRAEPGVGQVLLDIGAGRGAVGGHRRGGASRGQDGDQVKHRALVGGERLGGSRRRGGNPGQRPGVLAVPGAAWVAERGDHRGAQARNLAPRGQGRPRHLDDELFEAARELPAEGPVRLADQGVARPQRARSVSARERGVSAQGQVHGDRVRRAALDDVRGAQDRVRRPGDAGQLHPGKLHVQFCRLERLGRVHVKADEGGRVVRLP